MSEPIPRWSEVTSDPRYEKLSRPERDRLRTTYFNTYIRPKVPTEHLDYAIERFEKETHEPNFAERILGGAKDKLASLAKPIEPGTPLGPSRTPQPSITPAQPPAVAGIAPASPAPMVASRAPQAPQPAPQAKPPAPTGLMGAAKDAWDMGAMTLGGMIPKMPAAGEEIFRGAVRNALPAAAGLAAMAGGSGRIQSEIQQAAETPDAADQAMTQMPRSQTFHDWSKRGDEIREDIRKNLSPKLQNALEGSKITGNIFKGEVDFGSDPNLYGYAMQTVGVLASMGPMLATLIVSRNPAVAASVGGLMASGEGMDEARTFIGSKTEDELIAESPAFQGLVERGVPPEQARQIITDKAAEAAATMQGMVAAVGDVITGKLLTGAFNDILAKTSANRLGRVGAAGVASGAEGAITETAEGVATDVAIAGQVPTKEIGENSAENALMGAAGGAVIGGVAGAMSPAPAPKVVPERGPLSRAVNTGAEAEVNGLPTTPPVILDDDGTGLSTPSGAPKPPPSGPAGGLGLPPGQGPAMRPRIPQTTPRLPAPKPKPAPGQGVAMRPRVRQAPVSIAPEISQSLSQHSSRAASRYKTGIDESQFSDLAHRVMWQESRGRHDAVSPVGARGLMQVMPATAKSPGFGIAPLRDDSPEENMRFGTEYLAAMLERYDGDVQLALIAYNAGPGTADKYRAGTLKSLPKETQDYVRKITGGGPVIADQSDSVAPPPEDIDSGAPPVDPEVDLFGEPVRAPDAVPQNEVPGLKTVEVPLDDLSFSEDVPQFKLGANEFGEVEPLAGKFDRVGVAPIQIWERLDGSLKIISGRHRYWLAKRSGEKTIPAQIHREADGFTVEKARSLDAELNIRDGQGKAIDYVDYFRFQKITKQQAREKGLVARDPGKRGFTIAVSGSEPLIAQIRAGQIKETDAEEIALAAPGNEALQAVAIDQIVNQGRSTAQAVATMQAVQAITAGRQAEKGGENFDLFDFDDSQMREAERMGKVAAAKQAEIARDINAISGAAKRPEQAAKYGVNVKDPKAVAAKLDELKAQRAAWNNWPTNPDLVAQVRAAIEGPAEKSPTVKKADKPVAEMSDSELAQESAEWDRVREERRADRLEQNPKDQEPVTLDKDETNRAYEVNNEIGRRNKRKAAEIVKARRAQRQSEPVAEKPKARRAPAKKAESKPEQNSLSGMLEAAAKQADAEAERWAAKKYKDNKRKIEFEGDGPVRDGVMSIGAINEGRKQKAVEAARLEASGLRKLAAMSDAELLSMYSELREKVEQNTNIEKDETIEDVLTQLIARQFGMQYNGKGSAAAKVVAMLDARLIQLERGRADFEKRADADPEAWESLLFGEESAPPLSLDQQTPEQVKAQEAERKRKEAEEEAESAPDQRAAVDAEVDGFELDKEVGPAKSVGDLQKAKVGDLLDGAQDDSPRLRQGTATKQGMTPARIQSAIKPITTAWKGGVEVKILPNVNDLSVPDPVRKAHQKLGKDAVVDGVFYRGTVYLFSDA
ncbi:MAG: transglycosylase SLT domain-containing protein, partial [Anderseniella sp.]|nr:transglycosylase SLT domain-containing protein [Anderseniella sp.]